MLDTRRLSGDRPQIDGRTAGGQWDQALAAVGAAILDRLLHHAHAAQIQCDHYRLPEKRQAGLPAKAALNACALRGYARPISTDVGCLFADRQNEVALPG